jgi:hypothetical protein
MLSWQAQCFQLFTTSCWKQCFRNMVALLRNGERLLHECISSLSIECKSHKIKIHSNYLYKVRYITALKTIL